MVSLVSRLAALAGVVISAAQPAAADWTRSWVVEWSEPAMYYGGGAASVDQPGTDCPAGNNPDADWKQVLIDAGYSEQEAAWLEDPTHPWQIPNQGVQQLGFRGRDRGNVWKDPTLAKEKPFVGVTGKLAFGFNLDGDETTGFTSPDGSIKGVDNQFYKALGCTKEYRGPPRSSNFAEVANFTMLGGRFSTVIVASGKGEDPLNDPSVTIGIYDSTDAVVIDAQGKVTPGFTFRINPNPNVEAIFEARTVDGVIESTKPAAQVGLREPILQAQLRFTMHADGRLTGEVGGYRRWQAPVQGLIASGARRNELITGMELDQMWYTLRRHADYSPTGPGGERTHISFATHYDAVPAFVMTPDGSVQVAAVDSYKAAPRPPGAQAAARRQLPVRDGIWLDRDGTTPAGPDVTIPPPRSLQVAGDRSIPVAPRR
jgi:hypothetical protein